MPHKTAVRESLVPLIDYPHMPYWFSLQQAITLLRIAEMDDEPPTPRLVLVFDEKYQLLGLLRPEDILRGLEPRFLTKAPSGGWPTADSSELAALWNDPAASKEAAGLPVKDFMVPVKATVRVDDSLTHAASLMLAAGVPVLAAMEGNRVAGIVRLDDAYNAITAALTEG
ncbi:MAG: CBS domain-containing protein [Deltaproteobacteria bacterium]|nr:CBS domain-containing protein [Deltaproteobacteria bacterium]